MKAQVEAEADDTNVMNKNLMRCMNFAWRIKSGAKGVAQVSKGKVALTNMEFKEKCNLYGKYGNKQNKCPKKNKTKEGKKRKFSDTFNHCGKVGHMSANC